MNDWFIIITDVFMFELRETHMIDSKTISKTETNQ